MPQELPSMHELFGLAREAVRNAARLHTDARLLFDNERWASAHGLGVLALEEVGKAALCLGALSYTPDQAMDFWKDFRSHHAKLRLAVGTFHALISVDHSASMEALVERATVEAQSEHALRLRGLYVDHNEGDVDTPETVKQEAARRLLDTLGTFLDFLTVWTTLEVDEKIAELTGELKGPLLDLLKQGRQLVAVDVEAGMAIVRQFLQDDNSPSND